MTPGCLIENDHGHPLAARREQQQICPGQKAGARADIEAFHLRRYGMKKLSDWDYELTFSYQDDADLNRQVHDLLRAIDNEADFRHCLTEADVTENGTDATPSRPT